MSSSRNRTLPTDLPEDTKVCECASCARELVANEHLERVSVWRRRGRAIFGRVKGRPYCERCYTTEFGK